MHIAFVTTEYITERTFDGGLANYLHRIALSMADRGHRVEIFTRSSSNETLIHRGIPVHRICPPTRLRGILNRLTYNKLRTSVSILLYSWAVRRRFIRHHRQQPFDIIQATNLLASGLALSYRSPVPLVVRVSSHIPYTRRANNVEQSQSLDIILSDYLIQHTLKRVSGVYAPSKLLSRIIEDETGVPTNVIRPPFFIETNEVDSFVYDQVLKSHPYLLYFGTVNRLKGSVVLAKALNLALQRHPDMHFVIAGKTQSMSDGRTYLDNLIESVGSNSNRVHCVGRLPHSQLYPVIAGAKGVVLPSLIDNLPNTCLEAMSQGRVIIGTRGTSFEELIDPEVNGLLVSPGDERALVEAMSRVWMMSNSERERMGAEAKVKAQEEYSPENACQSLEKWLTLFIKKTLPHDG